MTEITSVTTADLWARLRTAPWLHTYDGVPIFEVGEGGVENVFTLGLIDGAGFAAAYDAYLRKVYGESLEETQGETLADLAAGCRWSSVRIDDHAEGFPAEFVVVSGGGCFVDVTVAGGNVW